MNLNTIVKTGLAFAKKNQRMIFTIGEAAGLAITTWRAIADTKKAVEVINAKELENPTKIEIVKETWKCYIPTAMSFTFTGACILLSKNANDKAIAAMSGLYAMSEGAIKEYKDAVVEEVGEEKAKDIDKKAKANKIKNDPPTADKIIIGEGGKYLCYDPYSGRYFLSSAAKLKRAAVELNLRGFNSLDQFISVNDWYDEIGLPTISIGEDIGWDPDNPLIIDFDAEVHEDDAYDDRPVLVVEYENQPRPLYETKY